MTQINQYSTRSTNESSSSSKGSADNPYTLEEFNAFEEGTWPGGYVETKGYVGPEVVIEGESGSEPDSSCSSEPDSEPTDNRPGGGSSGGSGGGGGGGGNYGGGGIDLGGGASDNSSGVTNGGNNNGNDSIINDSIINDQPIVTPGEYIEDVLSPEQFKGFLQSDPQGCFRRCNEMLAAAGCKLSGESILMMNYDDTTHRVTDPTSSVGEGLDYINQELRSGNPVIVAVDYKNNTSMGAAQPDQAGDHFVVIVGGNSSSGYHFYDPGTSHTSKGTSENNTFTYNNDRLSCDNALGNSNKDYVVSAIRKNQ